MEDRFTIAVGSSRMSKRWENTDMDWGEFASRCSRFKVTAETAEQYAAMSKDRQGEIKDCGGFVGAYLSSPQRTKKSVFYRTMLTLDLDHCEGATADQVWGAACSAFPGKQMVCYSTHKHTEASPRLRLCLPLARRIPVEAYEPLARKAASLIGIDWMDSTTYAVERLFYWPSRSKDGPEYYRRQDGEPLDLGELVWPEWTDPATWPRSANEDQRPQGMSRTGAGGRMAEDPLKKPGMIGAYCRVHFPIGKAVEELLGNEYAWHSAGRYTYAGGSTAGGAWVVDDRWLMSAHDSDPAHGLHNIFDLVRIHKYGDLDYGAPEGTPFPKLPSVLAMVKEASEDRRVAAEELAERLRGADKALEGIDLAAVSQQRPDGKGKADKGKESEPADWISGLVEQGKLEADIKGGRTVIRDTANNAAAIIDSDPALAGKLKYNLFKSSYDVGAPLPWARKDSPTWTDADTACLRMRLEKLGLTHRGHIDDALEAVFHRHQYHPVRDYLESLRWDGAKRLDTLLIDYLGADDDELTRAVTRKQLVGAVARIMDPGCKHDYTLVIQGPQGVGKSTLLAILGGEWFTDSAIDIESKDGMSALQGNWIIELGELASVKRADVSRVKNFLTSQIDKFRPAYAKKEEPFKRQCVFFGTTNEGMFLKGPDGNRRFWVVAVSGRKDKDWFGRLRADRDQIWAEAVLAYRAGEDHALLSAEQEAAMLARQEEANEDVVDPTEGMLREFLDARLPLSWDSYSLERRRNFWRDPDAPETEKIRAPRTKFCAVEFLSERMGIDSKDPRFNQWSRKVTAIMNRMEGWEKAKRLLNHCQKTHGRQRGWVRARDMENTEKIPEKTPENVGTIDDLL